MVISFGEAVGGGSGALLGIPPTSQTPPAHSLVVLHNYGGVYLDCDTLMLRDFAPLLGDEWTCELVRDGGRGATPDLFLPQTFGGPTAPGPTAP